MSKINNIKFHLILFVFLFPSILINAQVNYNLKTFSNDFEQIAKQPTNWDRNDWIKIVGVAGLTYGTMYLDELVREITLNNNSFSHSLPTEFGRIWGEPWLTSVLMGGFYLHGLATDNNANKKLGFEIGESALFTGLITLLLKYSFGRERPRNNSNPFLFHPFSFKDDNFLSLNSGHTALAFSLSTVLANNTSNNYLKVLFFTPAFLTAFSRVYQNHHWLSDVILGGIIGFSVAEFAVKQHKPKKSTKLDLNQNNPIPLFLINIPFN